ncbi:MAG: uroporphyrinogen decarboxylase family protein [Omnitrophica WOR_2 bacterium]
MNRRERVFKSLRHEQPDYVPYNFHASGSVYTRLRAHYGLPDNRALVDFIGNHIAKIGSDFNVNPWAANIQAQNLPSGGPFETSLDKEGGFHTDEFGCVWDRRGGMPYPVAYPLADPGELDGYRMPDPYHAGRFEPYKAVVEQNRGKVFLFGKLGMTLFERAWSIRGMQELLVDLSDRPDFVEELLDRILYEWDLPIIDQQVAMGVDGFYFADDWGSGTGLLMSPRMWRRFIKPRMELIYRHVREKGLIVGQHSDGNILAVMPDLIEIGLDVFNPVDPTAYDPVLLKEQYGDRLAFYGGINVKETLPFGTPEQVRREMLERAERLGDGGGYILQSSHTMLEDIPLANLVAYVETCHEIAGIDTREALKRISSDNVTLTWKDTNGRMTRPPNT